MLGVDDVLEHDETVSVEGDDRYGNMLFGHQPRGTFLVRDTDNDRLLKL